ncbi:hypothetical protein [Streptomyces sp. NPDC058572]|uniref:hypothetical protein n=1 Tax=Streptomyces sp. NPDC058572 TaxID=3346546 RepID=UPI00366520A6
MDALIRVGYTRDQLLRFAEHRDAGFDRRVFADMFAGVGRFAAEQAWGEMFGRVVGAVAGCFARREARATAAELIAGLLLEVDTRNCWTLAQALGYPVLQPGDRVT